MIRYFFTTLLLTAFLTQAQYTNQQIDSLVLDALDKFEVAGTAVAIVKDGKVVHSKGYGIKSVATGGEVDEHTNFAIASNSKAFTTTALALLVEEGKIDWKDKVVDHIPEFKMYNSYVTENFNIQDLLTHRSGLGLGIGDLMIFPDGSDFTIDDILTSFQYFKPVSALRTQFDYDNLLYLVAGELIARKSGMSWEAFVQKRIFEPLGMDRSYPSLKQATDKSSLASPHTTAYGELQTFSDYEEMVNGAAGGIYANVDDLTQWMLVHLNKGAYGGQLQDTLFTVRSQREMWKIHTTLNASTNPRYHSHFSGYGLGWFLNDALGNMIVSHTGGLPGMLSKTILVPDLKLGIVVLTNTEPGGGAFFNSVSQTILDSYLGLDNGEWVQKNYDYLQKKMASGDEVTKNVWKTVEAAKNTDIVKENFIGIYKDPWFGKVEVFDNNGQLWMKCHRSPKLNGPMRLYKANTFAVKWEYQDMNADAFAMFGLDEEGKAQSIKMKGISPNIDFSFDFQDLNLTRIVGE
ncbi:serine hydrolase [Flavobacteriaceae bacterium TP-CH-4]|uniref:Serine hydrolase n=1 Tax=Pelagihabitans pacificus TaxID=2696054 RepID=A0A967E8I5_9FLAO|nr:serine hydrolase [Pelagihabitans pacificus]NHF61324.1 serine hydrolase [Pelagihabitans pacificus]